MSTRRQKSSQAFWDAYRKFPKAKVRPQDQFPEFGDYRRKLNQLDRFMPITNPFVESILNWKYQIPQRNYEPNPDKVVEFIDSPSKFQLMMEHLDGLDEIAVDLEGPVSYTHLTLPT